MSLAREYNQENLVNVNKMQMRKIEEKINHNYFLSITKDSGLFSDRAVRICKNDDRIIFVSHYISNPDTEKGGLKTVYKVDKEIIELYTNKFGEL